MGRREPPDGPTRRKALLAEQRYRFQFLREDGRQEGLVFLTIALAYTAVVRNDFIIFQGRPDLFSLNMAIRPLLLGVGIAAFILLRRAPSPRRQDRIFAILLVALAILLSVFNLTRLQVGRVQGAFIGCGSVLAALYYGGRGPIVARAIFGCVISIGAGAMVILPDPRTGIDPPARLAGLIIFVVLNVFGVLSARSFDQQRRRRFEAERRERRANRELEKRIRELAVEKERAEASSRARAAFLAAMSHEFRTPMNAIIGLSDIVLDVPFGRESRSHVRAINDSARALLRLLEDVLDFAKIDAQKLTLASVPFDLRRLAASVIDMLGPAAAAGAVDLSVEVAPEVPPRVLGDDARLRQVLVNLVGNAVKFTRHGAVRLRIATAGAGGEGPTIVFRVEDTGAGMTPEVIARLFRPFEQGDAGHARRHGGTGLGLAISKQIVAAMGGDIRVESEPGRGSVFSFAIRLAATEAEAASPSAPRDRPPLSILVVDDHPINREVARAKLGRLGYVADLAGDGPAAIAAAGRRDYDVVFMDLHMPGMNGLDATAHLLAATAGRRAPRVVAMTASVFDEDREACRRAGMYDFVGKPVDLAALDAVLARVAEERGAAIPPAAPLAKAPLDVIRGLAAADDARFFEHICRLFLTDTRQRLVRMWDALGWGNAAALALDAHALKSASATVGATALAERCGLLEAAAREGRLEDAGPSIKAIEAHFTEVERALLAEMAQAPASPGGA